MQYPTPSMCWAPRKPCKPLLRPLAVPLEDPPVLYLPPPSPTPSDEAEDEGFVRAVCLDGLMEESCDSRGDDFLTRRDKDTVSRIIPGSKTLVVRDLPLDISMQQLRSLFGVYGPLRGSYLPRGMDPRADDYGIPKGYAHMTFMHHEDAVGAFRALYGQFYLRGQYVSLEFASL